MTQELQHRNTKLQLRCDELRDAIEEYQYLLERNRHRLNALESQRDDLQRRLDSAKNDIKKWQEDCISARKSRDHYVAQLDEQHRATVAERSMWLKGHAELQRKLTEYEIASTPNISHHAPAVAGSVHGVVGGKKEELK